MNNYDILKIENKSLKRQLKIALSFNEVVPEIKHLKAELVKLVQENTRLKKQLVLHGYYL